MTDDGVLRDIVAAAAVGPGDRVLEVGAGAGSRAASRGARQPGGCGERCAAASGLEQDIGLQRTARASTNKRTHKGCAARRAEAGTAACAVR